MEQSQQPREQREIQIVNLTSRVITPRPGQTYSPFTIYEIHGNDGNTYSTSSPEYFRDRKIGEDITIEYTVETKTSGNRVFTNRRIVLPSQYARKSNNLGEKIEELSKQMVEMEQNIISAIRSNAPDVENSPMVAEESTSLPLEEKDDPDIANIDENDF
jgi:hypothetical protein